MPSLDRDSHESILCKDTTFGTKIVVAHTLTIHEFYLKQPQHPPKSSIPSAVIGPARIK